MTLYPGYPRKVDDQWRLDDTALEESMAMAMEQAMGDVYSKMKEQSLPDMGKEDRRLLFVAIARGILQYLDDHQGAIGAVSGAEPAAHEHDVVLDVTMEKS
jgi:hypothetical protein